jgi:serine phosphatase RsbU (regulator of sigma subunit)
VQEGWSTGAGVGSAGGEAIARVLRSGIPAFLPEVTADDIERAAVDPAHHLLLRRLDTTSLIVVPLSVRGRILGSLTFAMSASGRRFDDHDFDVATEIGRRAAAAVDNARLYRERDHIAQTLQRSLLPPRLPEIPGFELAARYRPAGEAFAVGGDFYDAVPVRDGWSIVVGDVCGKGPEAAALTALARYTLRAGHMVEPEPARVLEMLNDALLHDHDDDRFLTVAAARLRGSTLDVAIAGQSPILLLRASGETEALGEPGRVVGIVPGLDLEQTSVELEVGDAVVLYTDGLTDAAAPGYLLHPEELATFAARVLEHGAAAVADTLENRALAVSNGHPRDDIALIVLRRTD